MRYILVLLTLLIVSYIFLFAEVSKSKTINIPIKLMYGEINGRPIKRICGTTCAEMILKYYGINNITNVDIAEIICAKINPAYNKLMYYNERKKIKYSTNCEKSLSTGIKYPGTNGPVLKMYFESLGLKTARRRAKYNKKTGQIPEQRFKEFLSYVCKKIPVIIHVQKHYMLVIGYDDEKSQLYIIDPSDKNTLIVNYSTFQNRNNKWRRTIPNRLGWDGRYIAVWK